MPGHNPLVGYPAGAPSLVGAGPADSTRMAGHPLYAASEDDAANLALSRKAGGLVAGAIALVILIHVGGFRSTVTIGG